MRWILVATALLCVPAQDVSPATSDSQPTEVARFLALPLTTPSSTHNAVPAAPLRRLATNSTITTSKVTLSTTQTSTTTSTTIKSGRTQKAKVASTKTVSTVTSTSAPTSTELLTTPASSAVSTSSALLNPVSIATASTAAEEAAVQAALDKEVKEQNDATRRVMSGTNTANLGVTATSATASVTPPPEAMTGTITALSSTTSIKVDTTALSSTAPVISAVQSATDPKDQIEKELDASQQRQVASLASDVQQTLAENHDAFRQVMGIAERTIGYAMKVLKSVYVETEQLEAEHLHQQEEELQTALRDVEKKQDELYVREARDFLATPVQVRSLRLTLEQVAENGGDIHNVGVMRAMQCPTLCHPRDCIGHPKTPKQCYKPETTEEKIAHSGTEKLAECVPFDDPARYQCPPDALRCGDVQPMTGGRYHLLAGARNNTLVSAGR